MAVVATNTADWDAAMSRLEALAQAAPKVSPKRPLCREAARTEDGVDTITLDHVREACRLWQQTRPRPACLRHNAADFGAAGMQQAMAAYMQAMADGLNERSAYPIRRRWKRVVRHVLFVTQYWPTEKDLMEAARDLAKGEVFGQ